MVTALLPLLVAGCQPTPAAGLDGVPPDVFALVPCWLSDTSEPVVTEVNLDAAAEDDNQFPECQRRGDWSRAPYGERGYRRYRILRSESPRFRVEFQENGGGTLTRDYIIEVELGRRSVDVDGRPARIRVLRVLSIQDNTGDRYDPDRITRGRSAEIRSR